MGVGNAVATILERVTTVLVSGAERFVVAEYLKLANVGYTNAVFDEIFLNMVYENVGDATLAISKLTDDSKVGPVMAELGEAGKTELVHFLSLIKEQSHGEEKKDGLIVTKAIVAFIDDKDGITWVMSAEWYSGGRNQWNLDAISIEDPDGWFKGSQVISGDS